MLYVIRILLVHQKLLKLPLKSSEVTCKTLINAMFVDFEFSNETHNFLTTSRLLLKLLQKSKYNFLLLILNIEIQWIQWIQYWILNQINKIFNQINKSIEYLIRSTKYLIDIYQLNGLIESIKFFSQCMIHWASQNPKR